MSDSGIGIKKENQNKVFKLFGSIKDEKKKLNTSGIGLGLVICRLIVQKFGGKIDYITKFKVGSTFFFTFKLEQINDDEINTYQHQFVNKNKQIQISIQNNDQSNQINSSS